MPLADVDSRPSMVTSGVALTKRTVYLSTTSTRSSAGQNRRPTGGISAGRSLVRRVVMTDPVSGSVLPWLVGWVSPNMRPGPKLATTSAAVNSSPLCMTTPRRRSSSTVLSSMRRQAVARPGTGCSWPW